MTTLAPPPRRPSSRPAPRPAARPAPRTFRQGDHVRRLRLWQLGLLILVTIVAGRVVDLQVIQGPTLAAAAEKSRMREVVIPATRGDITDANGVPLATTVAARNVTVDQTLVEDVEGTAAALASVLGGDASAYAPRLAGERRFVYIAKNVTPETWASVKALKLAGVFSEPTSTRVYPAGEVAANVVGHVRADGTGGSGLEHGLDDQLAGVAGSEIFESSARGTEIPTVEAAGTSAIPGKTVRLTIDRDIQWVAQDAIAKQVAYAKADSGTVVVMDPRTGKILALATVPTFDPNRPAEAVSADIGNRAVSDVFEPGSTSKVMTMAAVIEEKAAGPTTQLVIPPVLKRPAKTWHDHSPHGTLKLTLNGVLAKSSNIGTIMAAERIGGDTLYRYLKKFGIGEKTGLNFPGESKGYVPAPSQWSDTTFGTLAFGQGLSVNAVQAASVFATIANDGVRVTPSLVEGYTLPDGTYQAAPQASETRVVSTKTARTVRSMLESVVSADGTAPNAAIPGYRVAGKTGTANRIDDSCGCYRGYTASFIGIAPADNPSLVVAVFLQNPRNGHYGGVLAGPVFKRVTSFALQQERTPPTGSQRPRIPVEW
ncbi:peptidoglycan D,D-transpeptidase FtsI family protein [Longivirga aurantiaca]|uniref:Peptidoglycan D,D-transpeptidase FtsI family protein n=1 Tax=Longivirga aurantiaca TaxID=1837743 RepID=A0ABW1T3V2_9ACTN